MRDYTAQRFDKLLKDGKLCQLPNGDAESCPDTWTYTAYCLTGTNELFLVVEKGSNRLVSCVLDDQLENG